MKNKGYTLIELLGVIVILALLISFVMPSLIKSIKNSTDTKDELVVKLIYNAADLFIEDNPKEFYSIKGEVYCISISNLIENNYLLDDIKLASEDITKNKSIKATYTNKFNYEIVDSNSCKQITRGKFLSEYQPVEYIENTGTQYIDTGVIPNSSTGIDLVYQALVIDKSQYIVGVRETDIQYAINGSLNRTDWDIRFNGSTIYSNVTRTSDIWRSKISMLNGEGTWTLTNLNTNESNNFTISGKSVTATLPLMLFSYNVIESAYSQVHEGLRIYSCKIYEGEILVRDFVPCYRKKDSVIGMYDLVHDVFYTNEDSQPFRKGENVVEE